MTEVLPPRTQRERREATIGRLVEATIDAIDELGYAASSTKEICRRAGVSEGGMFRHFGSRVDLVCAAAEEVGRRQLVSTRRRLERTWSGDPVAAAVRSARRVSRDRINNVWFELLVAARTNAELRARLAPVLDRLYSELAEIADHVPGVREFPEGMRDVVLFSVLHMFDGETLLRNVYPRPDLERKRGEFLAAIVPKITE